MMHGYSRDRIPTPEHWRYRSAPPNDASVKMLSKRRELNTCPTDHNHENNGVPHRPLLTPTARSG